MYSSVLVTCPVSPQIDLVELVGTTMKLLCIYGAMMTALLKNSHYEFNTLTSALTQVLLYCNTEPLPFLISVKELTLLIIFLDKVFRFENINAAT